MPTNYTDHWVCEDCYFAHHYGWRPAYDSELPGGWAVGPDFERYTPYEPCSRLPHPQYVSDNTGPNEDDGYDPFSWRPCDGCPSLLGGSRYLLAVADSAFTAVATIIVDTTEEP